MISVVHESCFSESSKYLTEKLRLVNFLESDKEKMIDFGEIYMTDVRKVSYCVGIVSDVVSKVSNCVKIVSDSVKKV